ncbi:MAG: YdiU family protein [Bacteriovoracaceae bacterium]|jgi:serine/tyrosine/threonine adenylyltransferase|nr:YdiU family protein [Bacteriovoracaceae bacterium]
MNFDNTYDNLPSRFFADVEAAYSTDPKLLKLNTDLVEKLGLNLMAFSDSELAQIFVGKLLPAGSRPIAMAYAGHQFGHFVPQLGDGRAMLLGEVVDPLGKRFDIQLKGSGPTPFSRNGDGKSAIGPVIREYIVSEAMFHLGVPTTRALAAVATGDYVDREEPLPGAVFTRVASSHIRIGTFQYFAIRDDHEGLRALLDYSIKRHYPEIIGPSNAPVLFLEKVIEAQTTLVAKWMGVGFIHGVMNTDNSSISGETIDFGPCAFMENFNFNRVFSYIDRNGRYSYMNQATIIYWNLSRLADCLVPLVDSDEDKAKEILGRELEKIQDIFLAKWISEMGRKLGILNPTSSDQKLITDWLELLEEGDHDFTNSFRELLALFMGESTASSIEKTEKFKEFEKSWKERIQNQACGLDEVVTLMNSKNPIFIPRNHLVEKAIQGAQNGDLSVFHQLNELLQNPFEQQPKYDHFKEPAAVDQRVCTTYCGT